MVADTLMGLEPILSLKKIQGAVHKNGHSDVLCKRGLMPLLLPREMAANDCWP